MFSIIVKIPTKLKFKKAVGDGGGGRRSKFKLTKGTVPTIVPCLGRGGGDQSICPIQCAQGDFMIIDFINVNKKLKNKKCLF